MSEIYHTEKHAFKINFSFGIVLRNAEGELKYFYASGNDSVLSEPYQISSQKDLENLILLLRNQDLLQCALQSRPNSKWSVYVVTNIRWMVVRTNYILGAARKIPEYIKKKKCIIALNTNSSEGGLLEDKCAFRCLAYHRKQTRKGLERLTLNYYREYFGHRVPKRTKFNGLTLRDIPYFESTFDINVHMFQLFEDESCVHIYRSRGTFQETMNLNLYEDHLSYIKNLSVYCKKYECRNCKTLFPTHDRVARHEKRCKEATKSIFPGGYYARPRHIFQEFEYLDIRVDDDLRLYPFFITYDFEAMLQTDNVPPATEKSIWSHEHRPVSFSMCSNVPGHVDPVCEIESDVSSLIKKFVERASEIQTTAQKYMKTRFANVLKKHFHLSLKNYKNLPKKI